METPFFEFPAYRNPYYDDPRQRYYRSPAPHSGGLFSPNTRSVPVGKPAQPQPKVVSIPVRFVDTEKSRSVAAVKIQKVFRGFLVRRAVKKVLTIAADVAEIERRVAVKETAEMIWREEKERLRLNEMLMGLLFRLDSISGFDSGVRDCRKRVIRRVVALQERVDAIAAGDIVEDEERTDSEKCSGRRGEDTDTLLIDQAPGDENQGAMVEGDSVYQSQASEITPSVADKDAASANFTPVTATLATEKPLESQTEIVSAAASHESYSNPVQSTVVRNCDESTVEPMDEALGSVTENYQSSIEEIDLNCDESTVEPMDEALISVTGNYQSSIEEDNEIDLERGGENDQSRFKDVKEGEDQRGAVVSCPALESNPPEKSVNFSCEDYKGVVEKMVEENMKLQRLVADLCKRNVQESLLMNSLSQRVEQLERVMAKKKKRRQANGSVDDLRKCGKKL